MAAKKVVDMYENTEAKICRMRAQTWMHKFDRIFYYYKEYLSKLSLYNLRKLFIGDDKYHITFSDYHEQHANKIPKNIERNGVEHFMFSLNSYVLKNIDCGAIYAYYFKKIFSNCKNEDEMLYKQAWLHELATWLKTSLTPLNNVTGFEDKIRHSNLQLCSNIEIKPGKWWTYKDQELRINLEASNLLIRILFQEKELKNADVVEKVKGINVVSFTGINELLFKYSKKLEQKYIPTFFETTAYIKLVSLLIDTQSIIADKGFDNLISDIELGELVKCFQQDIMCKNAEKIISTGNLNSVEDQTLASIIKSVRIFLNIEQKKDTKISDEAVKKVLTDYTRSFITPFSAIIISISKLARRNTMFRRPLTFSNNGHKGPKNCNAENKQHHSDKPKKLKKQKPSREITVN